MITMTPDIQSIPLDEAISNARYVAQEGDITLHESDCIHRVIGEVFALDAANLALRKATEDINAVRARAVAERDQLVKELKAANTDGFGRMMNARVDSIVARYASGAMTGGKEGSNEQ